ncbi:MAG: protein kinase [Planctomycetales bacterium]|nr:protein kinase [Planctomycetales bacterium]
MLGRGGMGAVYLGEDPHLDRRVAIKVPFFAGADRQKVLDRFQREAKSIAAIQHPNICPIYEVGEVDGSPFMAMAFVKGKPLSQLIKPDKPLPIRPVLLLVRKIALALEEAHKRGIIHRDLKPANIMINERREPVVMDFGLARREGKGDEQLTRAGQVLGTPKYMPPEQVSGTVDKMGPGCDIYSLGVILYQLLTGTLPFTGDLLEVLSKIATEMPQPPSSLRSEIPPAVDEICLKAMAKNIDDRFRDMNEMANTLTQLLKTEGVANGARATPGASGAGPTAKAGAAAAAAIPSAPADASETALFKEETLTSKPKPKKLEKRSGAKQLTEPRETITQVAPTIKTLPRPTPRPRSGLRGMIPGGLPAAILAGVAAVVVIGGLSTWGYYLSSDEPAGASQRDDASDDKAGDGGATEGGGSLPPGPLASMGDEFDNPRALSDWKIPPHCQDTARLLEIANSKLVIEPYPGNIWLSNGRGPMVYKEIMGDFIVATRIRSLNRSATTQPATQHFNLGGLIARNPASQNDSENWIAVQLGRVDGATGLGSKTETTTDSQSNYWTMAGSHSGELRLCRIGSKFYAFRKLDDNREWEMLRWGSGVDAPTELDRPDMPSRLQVGLCATARADGDLRAEYDFIRFAVPNSIGDCTKQLPPAR